MNSYRFSNLLCSQCGMQLMLLFITIIVLLFCDIDSYFYAQIGQYDSAVFFMCGKALINGMVPYSEFADSKGLLLWLIYGIGYLFDHYSYVGIYWIMCVTVWVTLIISYKTANIYLDKTMSFLSAILVLVPLLHWNFYSETKAEQFCWPAIAWGIYLLVRLIKELQISKCHIFILGVCFVCCLMIKWSIALMYCSLVASIGVICYQNSQLKYYFLYLFIGIFACFSPFAFYFTISNSWNDMWQEYFVNTMSSVSIPADSLIKEYSNEWVMLISTKRILYLTYVLAGIAIFFDKKHYFISLLPILCGLFFIALSIRHDEGGHYLTIVGPYAVFPIIVILKKLQGSRFALVFISALCVLLNFGNMWGSSHYLNNFFSKSNPAFDKYMALSSIMNAASNNPRIIVIGMEPGLCMGSSLPGTKYWTLQKGRTEKMWNDQWYAISEGKADFIVLWGAEKSYYEKSLNSFGYHYLSDYYAGCVFSRYIQEMPKSIKIVSPIDIITKKNYCQLYQ